ncbi:replication initiation protein (plasmid) [Haloimpatiens sp. FM7315]|uniref:replication initiation protein n=1 Tax=Haloimpatiens sp. FM7315 TaxID=3298609 RepID=UPI0035A2A095
MDKNYIVTKANTLITANYNLSLQEQKLILTLASMVQPQDVDFKEYMFKIKDFMVILGVDTKTKYTEIPRITKELMKKVFEIREGKDILQLSWLSSARYKAGEGLVILKFDSSLKPYMLQLKKLYTSYKLDNILSLKSKYSLRLFEILKSNQFKKCWEIDLEELRKLLGAYEKSYSIYQNVKNRIILQAKKELKEKTDISFDFEEIKTGRKVTSIKFYIKPNKKSNIEDKNKNEIALGKVEEQSVEDPKTLTEEMEKINIVKESIKIIEKVDITNFEAKKILAAAGGDIIKITNKIDIIKKTNKEIRNLVGLLITALKEDYTQPKQTKGSKGSTFNDYEQRKYDYDDLEKKLLGWDKYTESGPEEDDSEKDEFDQISIF